MSMLTRRGFLQTSLAASALLNVPIAFALHSAEAVEGDIPFLVFIEGDSAQGNAFSEALSVSVQTPPSQIHKDVTTQMGEVENFCHANPDGVLFGLTRDSDFMVLEHIAAQQGFGLHYKGIHDFRTDTLRHQINAPQTIVPALASVLQHAQYDWPESLAHIASAIASATASPGNEEVLIPLEYRLGDPGYQVSWMMKTDP